MYIFFSSNDRYTNNSFESPTRRFLTSISLDKIACDIFLSVQSVTILVYFYNSCIQVSKVMSDFHLLFPGKRQLQSVLDILPCITHVRQAAPDVCLYTILSTCNILSVPTSGRSHLHCCGVFSKIHNFILLETLKEKLIYTYSNKLSMILQVITRSCDINIRRR